MNRRGEIDDYGSWKYFRYFLELVRTFSFCIIWIQPPLRTSAEYTFLLIPNSHIIKGMCSTKILIFSFTFSHSLQVKLKTILDLLNTFVDLSRLLYVKFLFIFFYYISCFVFVIVAF